MFGRIRMLSNVLASCIISISLESSAMEARLVGLASPAGNVLGISLILCLTCLYACGNNATSYVYCSKTFPSHIGTGYGILGELVGVPRGVRVPNGGEF
ncbi:hypothetical protein BDR07DRAFT_195181 [Suillus spraguei]|nr:hypothetical protein BDR07DRAFT_195181 [Suillus spraguei]